MRNTPASPHTMTDESLARMSRIMGEAVQQALLHHKRAGNPIAVWRDGRVVWIPPEEIAVDDPLAQ